jgi:hypothetical protein
MNQNNKFPRIIENRVRINIDFFCELSYNDFVANYFVIEKEKKIQLGRSELILIYMAILKIN